MKFNLHNSFLREVFAGSYLEMRQDRSWFDTKISNFLAYRRRFRGFLTLARGRRVLLAVRLTLLAGFAGSADL